MSPPHPPHPLFPPLLPPYLALPRSRPSPLRPLRPPLPLHSLRPHPLLHPQASLPPALRHPLPRHLLPPAPPRLTLQPADCAPLLQVHGHAPPSQEVMSASPRAHRRHSLP